MELFGEYLIGLTVYNSDFVPDAQFEGRKSRPVRMTDKEYSLFSAYAKEKGWPVTKTIRICTRAIILMEYKKANSLEEALKKSFLLDGDGRSK